MTVLTFLFFKHHSIDNCDGVIPNLVAIFCTFFIFLTSTEFKDSPSHSYPFTVNLDFLGIPLSYFPVNNPDASGDHIVVPSPYFL